MASSSFRSMATPPTNGKVRETSSRMQVLHTVILCMYLSCITLSCFLLSSLALAKINFCVCIYVVYVVTIKDEFGSE